MALSKRIELENGIIMNYHRIVSINKITNVQNIIEVASYTSESKREEEKRAIETKQPMSIYKKTNFFNTEYNENITIEQAYDYLKTTEMFEGAEDC